MRPKVGVFHPGTQHSWQTALAFQEAGQLGWYATSIFYNPEQFPYSAERLLPQQLRRSVQRRFLRRFNPELDPTLVRSFGMWEWLESAASSLRWSRLAAEFNRRGNCDFAKQVATLAEREPVDILWGFDTSSLHAFRWAKSRGIPCVLERTIVHPKVQNEVNALEYAINPEFFDEPWQPKSPQLIDEEDEEIALADLVVVGSTFCAESLIRNGCAAEKIRVVSYGYDERAFPKEPPEATQNGDQPLRCLFVGNVSARKGAAYLLKAFAEIPPTLGSLTLIGGSQLPPETFAHYVDRVRYLGALSRTEVIQHYRAADCLVFPSLIEGSAVVLREIYGAGLGALQTQAAGDGVVAGTNGAYIASRSVEDIVRAIENLAHDRTETVRWSRESWARRDMFTWGQYHAKIRDAANLLGA